MICKIKRIVSVLTLAAAIVSVVFLPKSASCETLRFVFLADSRGGNETEPINEPVLKAIILKIQNLPTTPSFVVFGGDMVYRGWINGHDILQEGKELFKPLTEKGIILYAIVGNHELYRQHAGEFILENQQEFQQVFTDNPTNGPPGYERLAYSFTSPGGDAFFAALDPYYLTGNQTSELGGNVTSAQLDWLADQVAHTKATHKFLFIHTPYYYVTGQDPDENSTSNQSHTLLWSLIDKNRFDFLACGHQHLFSWKTIDSTILPKPQTNPPVPLWQNNVVQLLNGTCGAGPDTSDNYTVDPTLWHVSNPHKTYYFSVVDINGNQVTVTSYKGNTVAEDYTVFDTFTINQNQPPGLVPALSKWSTAFCAVVLLIMAFALIRRRASKQG
jgi:3',5'-cyclic AMP phosphodiesterase CpdA